MTVEADKPKEMYIATGVTNFPFNFVIFDETDLTVTHINTDGVLTELVLSTDYTVTLLGTGKGSIDTVATYLTGQIEIRRTLPLTQKTVWPNGTDFDVTLLEKDLDRVVMIIQQQQVVVDEGTQLSQARGNWVIGGVYLVSDIVTAPNLNVYQSLVEHIAGADFTTDLNAGKWKILIDISSAATAATDAQTAQGLSEDARDASIVAKDASIVAKDASIVAKDASVVAETNAQLSAWEAEAEKMTADSYATEAEDVFVKTYASDGDGTFTPTTTTEYSALHWKAKAEYEKTVAASYRSYFQDKGSVNTPVTLDVAAYKTFAMNLLSNLAITFDTTNLEVNETVCIELFVDRTGAYDLTYTDTIAWSYGTQPPMNTNITTTTYQFMFLIIKGGPIRGYAIASDI